jgi:hypothetical protein
MLRLGLVSALLLLVAPVDVASAQPADSAAPADAAGSIPLDPFNPLDPDPDQVPGLDETSSGFAPTNLHAPVAVVEGKGVKVGEGTSLYPTVGLDTGFVSNVFYEDSSPAAAGVMRLMAGIGTGSLSGARLAPRSGGTRNVGSVQHRASLRLSYDFWLSGNDYVNEQNGLGISATVRGVFGPQRTWSFLYLDNFDRIVRAANFESNAQVTRDINRLVLGVQFAPPGRSIRTMLSYSNTLDLFESDDHEFANRMQNALALTGAWRFRPYTVLFATVSQGFYLGIGSDTMYANQKVDSYPLTVSTGIQTLLSLKTSLTGRIGYTNGFYSTGPSYNTVLGGVELGWRYSPLGRVTAMYEYRHDDSINANYYRDHRLALDLQQQFVPLLLNVTPQLMFRHYEGITTLVPTIPDTRDDVIVHVPVALRYYFRDSFAAVLQYRYSAVLTDYMYSIDGDDDDPSFSRHEVILGVRAGF